MDLYTQHFRGRVLTIVTNCSYSGSWVREAMTFMDEQGVGPCGHVAKEKGILVKVFASCLANEIPAELAFSTHCPKNNKSTGYLSYMICFRGNEIYDGQHPSGIDFTRVQCKNMIDHPCTMAPGSTWKKWSTAKRLFMIKGTDRGQQAWQYVKLMDNEDARKAFDRQKTTGSIDTALFEEIVRRGWGKDPPNDIKEEIIEHYLINYGYSG